MAHPAYSVPAIPVQRRASAAPLRIVAANVPACSTCGLRTLCMPLVTALEACPRLDDLVSQRTRLRKGDSLVQAGDRFSALYSIRSGSCKSVITTASGQEQIAGYHIGGDLIGAEAIFAGVHGCEVVALEDSEVCVLPFDRVEALARDNGQFQHNLHGLLSREIARERRVLLMLGTMRAEQRLASFLLDLAERYYARGYSSSEFVLRMTREEIGSHLGLKLETVSRLFSRFHQDGLIRVQGRDVRLLDRVALQQLVNATTQ